LLPVLELTGAGWTNINNVKLYYDGVQIGVIENTAVASTTYTKAVNFTAPVGATKFIEVKADIQGTGLGVADNIVVTLATGASNAQRLASLGSFNFPTANTLGNVLTVSASAVIASKNLSVGNISAVNGQPSVTIGSYLITAGSAEGVDISLIRFEDGLSSVATTATANQLGSCFNNLELYYGTTKLGSTITANSAAPAATYNFYPSSFSLIAGQQITVSLKAEVNSTGTCTWTNGNATKLSRIESSGQVTTNAANFVDQEAGQGLTISGAGVLSAAVAASTPEPAILATGETDQTLAIWELSANNTEDLTVYSVWVFSTNTAATSSGNVTDLELYCGTEKFGETVSGLSDAVTDYAVFAGGACVVPKGDSTLLTLKGDITSYASGPYGGGDYILATDYLEFKIVVPATITGISTNQIIARGAGDYASTVVSSNVANRAYVYRTTLTPSIACHGTCATRSRSANDVLADLTLTSAASKDVKFRASV